MDFISLYYLIQYCYDLYIEYFVCPASGDFLLIVARMSNLALLFKTPLIRLQRTLRSNKDPPILAVEISIHCIECIPMGFIVRL